MSSDTHMLARLRVGDEWIDTGDRREVRSPWDGAVVGQVGVGGRDHAAAAIDAAATAMATPLPRAERAALLESLASLVGERADQFAHTISGEAGKPITLARVEVDRAQATLRAAAAAARTLTGSTLPMDAAPVGDGRIGWTARVPVGVVGAITPFNFPLNLVLHKVAAAIAAGCAIVLKPASQTPLTALLLAHAAEDAGLPAGWFNVVVGRASEIADAMIDDERLRLLTFTGSATVGHGLERAANGTRVTLELGNATPLIVDRGADLDAAAATIAASGYGYAGQTCISTQRVYAHADVIDELRPRLVAAVEAVRSGDPSDAEVSNGPLITADDHQRVLDWIDDAVQRGGALLTGGADAGHGVVQPTLVEGAPADATLSCNEVFGPVVTLDAVPDLATAIARSNDTPYGLQAAIFTGRLDSMLAAADGLQFGSVMVNESPSFRADHMPYGGTKASGNTKEGPAYAVREMTEERLIVVGGAASRLT